jgi:hypothetical protein
VSLSEKLSERAERAYAQGGVVGLTWAEYMTVKQPTQPVRPILPMSIDGVPAIIVDLPPRRPDLVHP